ncbi:MAG: rod shape-determining protein MreD [Lachnospiraceae bacterium]|nr:rod shape-determining protein MreD [Lachnospiraceae bacterium]
MRIGIIIKRIIIYFLLILAAFLMQTCVFPILGFLSAIPNLILIITFSYGYIYGTMTGMICGFFAGLLMDLFYPEAFGLFILFYSYLGFFSGLFSKQLKNDSLIFPLILCTVNELVYNGALLCYRFIAVGRMNIIYSIFKVIIPELFFTLIITIIAYRILLNTNRKLDKIDNIRGKNVA